MSSQRYGDELGGGNEARRDGGESNEMTRLDETYLVQLVMQKKLGLDKS
jgi:hypothetical protein